ncbi:DUF6285 domain-containing protein [Mycobacterium aquaticum]|uniref:DUF6285 domain-containing protein n=1 Tax=Mycobacterium aquaticum TaxID=1927124 RepID=UPI0009F491CE|nr:DUF6285 domain-containing protein [Mycobacterium aquaticum]
MTGLHYKPTAAELVAAVAEFLETEVRDGTDPDGRRADAAALRFHARVAANVLRTVERELLDDTADEPARAMRQLGFDDEAELAAAIRAGDCGDEVLPALHALVRHRLRVAHPGYERE